jgi:hypothetical protein
MHMTLSVIDSPSFAAVKFCCSGHDFSEIAEGVRVRNHEVGSSIEEGHHLRKGDKKKRTPAGDAYFPKRSKPVGAEVDRSECEAHAP